MFSTGNYIALFVILIALAFLYRKLEDKRIREEDLENYGIIKKYLLNDHKTLGKTKKPILWIHIPYEYNSRQWLSFGSRSSHELNQPYMYLTVKTIIDQCHDSFHICMIDDDAFSLLIPDWKIQMNRVGKPISHKLRMLALANILYVYGGMILPISFLCLKDLESLYEKGVQGDRMFVCEDEDKNVSSTYYKFYPTLQMMGSPRKNETLLDLIRHMEWVISRDYTAESHFKGDFSEWCEKQVQRGAVNMIDGRWIGVKGTDGQPIGVNELLSENFIPLDPQAYGILIPAMDILKRHQYEWFARSSVQQVLDTNTIVSQYFKLSLDKDGSRGVIEPMEVQPSWVRFWKTPLVSLYGLKPNFLGDNLLSNSYPNY